MTASVVPRDFPAAVRDIKLAILQARARAARASNAEALKLYFFVGGYVSAKTLGIATYRTLRSISEPYKSLAPVIDGVKRVLTQAGGSSERSGGNEYPRPRM